MNDTKSYKNSANTPLKQYSLKWMLWWHMDIVKTIWKKYPYHKKYEKYGNIYERPYKYFELHGGIGKDKDGNLGSPLIFHKVATEHEIPFEGIIFEKEEDTFKELEVNAGALDNLHLINKDHNVCIELANQVQPKDEIERRRYQYGVVYSDPSNADPSFDVLRSITTAYPRVDIIINLAVASYKRTRHLDSYKNLKDVLFSIKKIWIFRKPVDTHQWTMMLGSDWLDFPQWEEKGFVRFDSELGREWFDRIVYTKEELHSHANIPLFNWDDEPIVKKK